MEGRPFCYLGETCWLLFQGLNHEELDEDPKDRAAKGYTAIQAYVLRGAGQETPGRQFVAHGRDCAVRERVRPKCRVPSARDPCVVRGPHARC